MWLRTGQDLAEDALFLAGEPALGAGSQYEARVYEWLTVVQRSLVSGGTFGPSRIKPMDWPWARSYPRGSLQLQQAFNQAGTYTATFTAGSDVVTVVPAWAVPYPDLKFWRLAQASVSARQIIKSTGSNSFRLLNPWTGDNLVTNAWQAYPDTYFLPGDFVRGCSPFFIYAASSSFTSWYGAVRQIDVVDPADLESLYPMAMTLPGLPVLAARVSEDRVRFSHYLSTASSAFPVQLEFEYIARPEFITGGAIPRVPLEHRRVLSYGAAYLILDDKDDSGAQSLWAKFLEQYRAMGEEYQRTTRRMSPGHWGRIMPSIISTGGQPQLLRGMYW